MMEQKKQTTKKSASVNVEYHADDFALFPAQSRRILDCHIQGKLNGVSVMPNSETLGACMALLEPVQDRVAVTVHLNLIEGKCLSTPRGPWTDEQGVFQMSFGALLLGSYLPGRKILRQWLKGELGAQIQSVAEYLPDGAELRLDGHAHYHMIPVVFDALMELLRERAWKISYIRIPREYPGLYLRHWTSLRDFSAVNLVKVMILNLLAARNRRKYRGYLDTLEKKLFLGVFLSGRMYRESVEAILPDALALAEEKGWGLEVLAHPGGVEEPEDIAKLTNREDIAFLTDIRRRKEAELFAQ